LFASRFDVEPRPLYGGGNAAPYAAPKKCSVRKSSASEKRENMTRRNDEQRRKLQSMTQAEKLLTLH
jgi:hypothetical protein